MDDLAQSSLSWSCRFLRATKGAEGGGVLTVHEATLNAAKLGYEELLNYWLEPLPSRRVAVSILNKLALHGHTPLLQKIVESSLQADLAASVAAHAAFGNQKDTLLWLVSLGCKYNETIYVMARLKGNEEILSLIQVVKRLASNIPNQGSIARPLRVIQSSVQGWYSNFQAGRLRPSFATACDPFISDMARFGWYEVVAYFLIHTPAGLTAQRGSPPLGFRFDSDQNVELAEEGTPLAAADMLNVANDHTAMQRVEQLINELLSDGLWSAFKWIVAHLEIGYNLDPTALVARITPLEMCDSLVRFILSQRRGIHFDWASHHTATLAMNDRFETIKFIITNTLQRVAVEPYLESRVDIANIFSLAAEKSQYPFIRWMLDSKLISLAKIEAAPFVPAKYFHPDRHGADLKFILTSVPNLKKKALISAANGGIDSLVKFLFDEGLVSEWPELNLREIIRNKHWSTLLLLLERVRVCASLISTETNLIIGGGYIPLLEYLVGTQQLVWQPEHYKLLVRSNAWDAVEWAVRAGYAMDFASLVPGIFMCRSLALYELLLEKGILVWTSETMKWVLLSHRYDVAVWAISRNLPYDVREVTARALRDCPIELLGALAKAGKYTIRVEDISKFYREVATVAGTVNVESQILYIFKNKLPLDVEDVLNFIGTRRIAALDRACWEYEIVNFRSVFDYSRAYLTIFFLAAPVAEKRRIAEHAFTLTCVDAAHVLRLLYAEHHSPLDKPKWINEWLDSFPVFSIPLAEAIREFLECVCEEVAPVNGVLLVPDTPFTDAIMQVLSVKFKDAQENRARILTVLSVEPRIRQPNANPKKTKLRSKDYDDADSDTAPSVAPQPSTSLTPGNITVVPFTAPTLPFSFSANVTSAPMHLPSPADSTSSIFDDQEPSPFSSRTPKDKTPKGKSNRQVTSPKPSPTLSMPAFSFSEQTSVSSSSGFSFSAISSSATSSSFDFSSFKFALDEVEEKK